MTIDKADLDAVAHITQNAHGATKLLVSLSIETRAIMAKTSDRAGVSQQHLVQVGTRYWADIVNHALDLGLSLADVHESVKTYLSTQAKVAQIKATKKPAPKAKAAPKAAMKARKTAAAK